MRLATAALCFTLPGAPGVIAQALSGSALAGDTCSGITGEFMLKDMDGHCAYDRILAEYKSQVYDAPAATGSCANKGVNGTTVYKEVDAKTDLDAKLMAAYGTATGKEAAVILCKALYDGAPVTPFYRASDKGTDMHFEKMFYNGLGDWQEEVETLHEPYRQNNQNKGAAHFKDDGRKLNEFFQGEGSYSRLGWPDSLTNFDPSTCKANAAMCVWPKDRQANDNNGNCAKPYDENCVDKDVADNTNLCFADLKDGAMSNMFGSDRGFFVFPGDNDNGEGAIHCHGHAWADDEYHHTARYKANNLFFVSMYDHLYQRGYVKEIPGAPMCGCIDQMPITTRCDCTQTDLKEYWEVAYDGKSFAPKMVRVEIDFNACQGRNNQNNNLRAYVEKMYDEGKMTAWQLGRVVRKLPNDNCGDSTKHAIGKKGFFTGYEHDKTMWTKVAGRDELHSTPMNSILFNIALGDSLTPKNPIIHRACASCTHSHQHIYYRRLTTVPSGLNLLDDILRGYSTSAMPGNKFGVDFSLHSSYEDAKRGADPWKCTPGFNYQRAFTGDCSPTGATVTNQYSNWKWGPSRSNRKNVAYFLNKPEASGTKFEKPGGIYKDSSIGTSSGNTVEDKVTKKFLITSKGGDISRYADNFEYLSQAWEGDVDVQVRIDDFTAGHKSSKAGIMLRTGEGRNDIFVMLALTFDNNVKIHRRVTRGRYASEVADPTPKPTKDTLSRENGSCPSINTREKCIASKDGRTNGFRDMACNWCCGKQCGSAAAKCEPRDWLVRQRTYIGRSENGLGEDNCSEEPFLRITKKGNSAKFYTKADGEKAVWNLRASTTTNFPGDKFRVGLAASSYYHGYTSDVLFSNYVVVTNTTSATPSKQANTTGVPPPEWGSTWPVAVEV